MLCTTNYKSFEPIKSFNDKTKPLTHSQPQPLSQPPQPPKRKKRSYLPRDRPRDLAVSQYINNIPHNCYWCCKPEASSASASASNSIWSQPRPQMTTTISTTSTTSTTTRYWWYPNTTKRTTPSAWWIPASTTSRPWQTTSKNLYEPEVIEAKTRSFNEVSSHNRAGIASSFLSPASQVLLKFTKWKQGSFEPVKPKPIKDDFIIIEDNYRPEIIEAVQVK